MDCDGLRGRNLQFRVFAFRQEIFGPNELTTLLGFSAFHSSSESPFLSTGCDGRLVLLTFQSSAKIPTDFFALDHLESQGFLLNRVTNNSDFSFRSDFCPSTWDSAFLTSSKIDSCYFCDDEKHAQCLDATVGCAVIDSRAKGFCYFRKLNFRGFSQGNFSLIFVQYPNSIVPNLMDFVVQREIDACGNSEILPCVSSVGICGQDYWGRSAYAICCVNVHSHRRYFHLSSMSCLNRKDPVNSEPTSNALESVVLDEPYLSLARVYPDQRTRDLLEMQEHS